MITFIVGMLVGALVAFFFYGLFIVASDDQKGDKK